MEHIQKIFDYFSKKHDIEIVDVNDIKKILCILSINMKFIKCLSPEKIFSYDELCDFIGKCLLHESISRDTFFSTIKQSRDHGLSTDKYLNDDIIKYLTSQKQISTYLNVLNEIPKI